MPGSGAAIVCISSGRGMFRDKRGVVNPAPCPYLVSPLNLGGRGVPMLLIAIYGVVGEARLVNALPRQERGMRRQKARAKGSTLFGLRGRLRGREVVKAAASEIMRCLRIKTEARRNAEGQRKGQGPKTA